MLGLPICLRHSTARSSMASGTPSVNTSARISSAELSKTCARTGCGIIALKAQVSCSIMNVWLSTNVSSLSRRSMVSCGRDRAVALTGWPREYFSFLLARRRSGRKHADVRASDELGLESSFFIVLTLVGYRCGLERLNLAQSYCLTDESHIAQKSICLEGVLTEAFQCRA